MRVTSPLILLFCLSLSTTHAIQKIKIKPKKFKNLKFGSYSTQAFHKDLFSKKNSFPVQHKYNTSINQKIPVWQQPSAKFYFDKQTQWSPVKEKPQNTGIAHIKAQTEQREEQKNKHSYWSKFLAAIAAALIGGKAAQTSNDEIDADPMAQEQFKELRTFIALVEDPELKKRWDMCMIKKECSSIAQDADLITIIDREPYIVLKDHQFDRVVNAKIAETVIKENNLNLIGIAKKTILFDGKTWKVVAEKMNGEIPTKLSLEQVQQLTKFAQETGYFDWKMENLMLDKKSGKIFIIDTENRSFANAGYNKHNYVNTLLTDLTTLKKEWRLRNIIDRPTQQWLEAQVTQCNNAEGKKRHSPLPSNPSLNRSLKQLNVQKVREQAKKYADMLHIQDKDKYSLRHIKIISEKNQLLF